MMVYHATTHPDAILKDGILKVNQSGGFTEGGFWADAYYGMRPIYVSLDPGKYPGETIDVEVDESLLFADLPSLIDSGAIITDSGDSLYWENEPEQLQDFLEEGEIDIQSLLRLPEAIQVTRTGVILQDIEVL
jgi:hypothetical protein